MLPPPTPALTVGFPPRCWRSIFFPECMPALDLFEISPCSEESWRDSPPSRDSQFRTTAMWSLLARRSASRFHVGVRGVRLQGFLFAVQLSVKSRPPKNVSLLLDALGSFFSLTPGPVTVHPSVSELFFRRASTAGLDLIRVPLFLPCFPFTTPGGLPLMTPPQLRGGGCRR